MSEATEQAKVVRRLRAAGILFCHVPNGLEATARATKNMAAQGVRPGVPDLLIFDPPPNCPGKCGTALEMKTAKFTESQLRRSQRIWLADLADRNWISLVGHGAEHAIAQLQELGYSL